MANNIRDLTGQTFGMLKALKIAGKSKIGAYRWEVQCECGTRKICLGSNLIRGHSKSCGCLQKKLAAVRQKSHGMSQSREYRSYTAMLNRCCNPNNHAFENYLGRGIAVCDRWLESFENFYADMGPRPSKHSLDRIDNNGPYSPENCRWATSKQQNGNRRDNIWILYNGVKKPLIEWAKEYNMCHTTLRKRLFKWNLSVEDAITRPLRKKVKAAHE
jgi:hypothetical protein